MMIETQLTIGAVALCILSLAITLLTRFRQRGQETALEKYANRVEILEETLSGTKELLEENRQNLIDQTRRIAWLDAKTRQSRFFSVAGRKPARTETRPTSGIDEQRVRVLRLAESGQTANTIAASLGMMPGEVELILNLSNHNAAVA